MFKLFGFGKKPTIKKTKSQSQKKKDERDAKEATALKAKRVEHKKKMDERKKYYLEAGKKHYENFVNNQTALINKRREATAAGSIYVDDAPKAFFVIRIKGLNKIPPKEKKILQLFRLRQLHNAVFIRNNKASMNMLRRVEPWVTYGPASHAVVRRLIYKRGYGRVNKQRIPLDSNLNIEECLGKFNIKCIEDLIHEIHSVGPNFKEANAFLWPFKLNSPKGGIEKKRHPYLEGGAHGPRDEFINDLAKRML